MYYLRLKLRLLRIIFLAEIWLAPKIHASMTLSVNSKDVSLAAETRDAILSLFSLLSSSWVFRTSLSTYNCCLHKTALSTHHRHLWRRSDTPGCVKKTKVQRDAADTWRFHILHYYVHMICVITPPEKPIWWCLPPRVQLKGINAIVGADFLALSSSISSQNTCLQ